MKNSKLVYFNGSLISAVAKAGSIVAKLKDLQAPKTAFISMPRLSINYIPLPFSNARMHYKSLAVLLLLLFLGGCASNGQFRTYPELAANLQSQLKGEQILGALTFLEAEKDSRNDLLYDLEKGLVYQLQGDTAASRSAFERAIYTFSQQDLKATIDLSDSAAKGLALISNENVIPYQGSAYERIMLHHYQAINYLIDGNIEGAGVELRRARLEQEVAQQKNAKELAEAQEKAAENNIELDPVLAQIPGLEAYAGKAKSAFQNAYTFYFSAAFWEATGELNSALIDYKKALEINPGNEALLAAVKRVESRRTTSANGRVWVFYEQGFIPAKQAEIVDVPNFDGGLISIALPYYQDPGIPVGSLIATSETQVLGESQIIADTGAMAAKNLQQKMPALVVRQILRAFSKYQLQRNIGDNFGFGAQLIANVYNKLSERADLRSWLTLPNFVQAAEFELRPGKHSLSFEAAGKTAELDLQIKPGDNIIIRVSDASPSLLTNVFSFN